VNVKTRSRQVPSSSAPSIGRQARQTRLWLTSVPYKCGATPADTLNLFFACQIPRVGDIAVIIIVGSTGSQRLGMHDFAFLN